MRQIKTIRDRLNNCENFDRLVNEALANGWRLTRREILIPAAQVSGQYTYIMLYAELERGGQVPYEPHFRDDRGVSG